MKIKAPKKTFADRRFGQERQVKAKVENAPERLTGVALKRDGVIYATSDHEHWALRYSLWPDADTHETMKGRIDDEPGFRTNLREWISRAEAAEIGRLSGQVSSQCRELLSCDVDRWAVS